MQNPASPTIPPNGKPTLKTTVQTLDTVQGALQAAHTIHRTWRKVSIVLYGCAIPAGTLSAVAKGRDPKNPKYRVMLGLPALIEVEACSRCGKPHTLDQCTEGKQVVVTDAVNQVKITPPRKPRRPRPPRIAIRLDDPASAARSILAHMPPDIVSRLVESLTR